MKMKSYRWRILLMIICALATMGIHLDGSRFEKIVSFGDSMSDASNLGPLSNGPVWPQYLAGYLELDLYDYAFAGARTGYEGGVIGFLGEVDLFLEDAAIEGVSNRDLFTVVIGGNDFIAFYTAGGPNPIPGSIVNTVTGVQRLLEAGVRYMVVWTAPDLAVAPATAHLTVEEKEAVTMLSGIYNAALIEALKDLASGFNCKLVIVDINAALYDMTTNPDHYGLTNVVSPAKLSGENPATYLFWDMIHATTYGHQLLAEYVLDCMLNELVPGEAIGLDRNLPGWIQY